jgi:plastocyanin
MRRSVALVVLAFAAVPAMPAHAGGASVSIVNFAFTPADLTADLGSTVTFVNASPSNHTSTADGGFWNTGSLDAGQRADVELTSAGTFAYHCQIHITMHGVIVVPLDVTPGGSVTVGTEVTITFASAATAGRTTVLERKRGARPWRKVTLGTGATSFSFTPHRAGKLRFRAATVEAGVMSGTSPRVLVRVTAA